MKTKLKSIISTVALLKLSDSWMLLNSEFQVVAAAVWNVVSVHLNDTKNGGTSDGLSDLWLCCNCSGDGRSVGDEVL